jgi:protein-S-isoprenylcysteine O-methyltransferase Ste14
MARRFSIGQNCNIIGFGTNNGTLMACERMDQMDGSGEKKPGALGSRMVVALLSCPLTLLVFGLPLFLSAGSICFANAWLFLGVMATSWFLILAYLAVNDPVLFEKRTTARKEEYSQTLIKLLLTCALLLALIISGLDFRFRWSNVPPIVGVVFTLVVILGNLMLFVVIKQNTYGSRAVEIQAGQKVIDTGLYALVRHPMYLAFAILFCFSPLVLGSYYALIPALFIPLLLALRIRNEEKLLQKDLEGYPEYIQKVKYRLIPFLW